MIDEDRYKNRELDAKHDEIMNYLKGLESKMDTGFKGVYDRQDKTNGRVNKLEGWRNRIVGGLIVVSSVLVPVCIAILNIYL